MFAHAEALIQSADRETWQTTSIMASELIGKGGGEEKGEKGGSGGGGEVGKGSRRKLGFGGVGGLVSKMSLQFPPFFTTYCLQLFITSIFPILVLQDKPFFKVARHNSSCFFGRKALPGGEVKMRIPANKPNTSV